MKNVGHHVCVCTDNKIFGVDTDKKTNKMTQKKGKNSASSSILPSKFIQLPLVITLSAQVTYLPWLPHLGGIHKYHQIFQ